MQAVKRVTMQAKLRRFGMFNTVGAIGIAVQIAALAVLRDVAGFGYLPATAIAVEIAVLHNFFWHERWTWGDVTARRSEGLSRRLIRFHISTGLISVAGNLLLMSALVGGFGINYVFANLTAIAVCWLLNFAAGDRFVFASDPDAPRSSHGA
jgi:putative flippase GtrA